MIERFLKHVLPEQGLYCLATPTDNGYVHKVVDSIEKLSTIAKQTDNSEKDTFFAVGTLKELRVWNPDKKDWQGNQGKFEIRVHRNISNFKTLILDLDCNGTKKYEYPDQQSGLEALKSFVSASGMPIPTVVNSGRGLHVYWTLEDSISADAWYDLSVKASIVYTHFGLKVDPSRVKDRSSVLRVAGTHHYKDRDNVKTVSVIRYGQHTPVSDIESILDKSIAFYNLSVPVRYESKTKNNELLEMFAGIQSNLVPAEPIDIDLVFSKCQQMARIREIGGPVGYNMRCSAASIIKFSIDKDYSILWANDEQKEVVKHQTEMMLEGSITDNPHTCERFEESNPGGCRGCSANVKSPVVLGRVYKEVVQNIIQEPIKENLLQCEESDDKIKNRLPDPPFPYFKSESGINLTVSTDEDGKKNSELIYEYAVYPYEIIWDYRENGLITKARVHLPHDGEREFVVPAIALADNKALAKILANAGVIAQSNEKSLALANYMSNYIRELQKHFKSTKNYAQLGWQEDSTRFVLPETTINTDGTTEQCGVSPKLSSITKSFRKKGTLQEWKEVIDVYSQSGYEAYAFGHLAGYGSILFDLTEYHGAIINLIGNSGSGKSTVLKTINSIFGHPEEGMLMQHDKYLARMNRIGVYNSIPATYDEITKIPKEELSDLCYSISQGRGRHRLDQNAAEKENNTTWKMIMTCSSNASLYDILGTNSSDSSAEAMRVFEYRMDRQNVMQAQEAQLLFSKLNDNFGHAGEIFITYVAQHRAEIKDMIIKLRTDFGTVAEVPIQERYWANIVACCLVGGRIAKRLGLHNFDLESLFKWAVNQIKSMRTTVSEIKRDSRSLLVDFMNANISSTITVKDLSEKSNKQYVPAEGEPRSGLVIRNEVDRGIAYIPRDVIRNWLIKGGADFTAVKKDLRESGILLNDSTTKVLSAGSSTIKSGQSYCWMISTAHPMMAGSVLSSVILKNATTEIKTIENIA